MVDPPIPLPQVTQTQREERVACDHTVGFQAAKISMQPQPVINVHDGLRPNFAFIFAHYKPRSYLQESGARRRLCGRTASPSLKGNLGKPLIPLAKDVPVMVLTACPDTRIFEQR